MQNNIYGLELLKPIRCPSCKSIDAWKVSFDSVPELFNRIIIDCHVCDYRISLPMDLEAFNKIGSFSSTKSILEYDTKEKVKR